MGLLIPFGGKVPRIAPDAFVAPTAVLIGDVAVESQASVWFGAILRGDHPEHGIVVGPRSSIQDNCVVHVGDWGPTVIGPDVTVGHGAIMESCSIGAGSVIGMNAVILQDVVIGRECLVAAGCVVRERHQIPDRSVVAGVPGSIRKNLDGVSEVWVGRSAQHYVRLSRNYLREGMGHVAQAGGSGSRGAVPSGADDPDGS